MCARCVSIIACLLLAQPVFGQGFVLSGTGAANSSMGGAATAAPIDAVGALNWNPATISGLPQSRVDLNVELVHNRNTVNSGILVGTPGELSGHSESNAGVWALPAIGVVYKPENSRVTYGLGMNAIGGFFVNFPGSATNPIFTPPPPAGVGFGPAYTRLGILQFAPTLSFQLTDRLSIGVAPTINVADVQGNPFPFTMPDDANGDMFFTYPDGRGNRNIWGGGIQAGIYYASPGGLNLGASIKSPQWFERLEINSADETGLGREITTQIEYPMMVSVGAAYTGIKDVLLAVDVRYVDFGSTQGFGEAPTLTPTGALRGLGWESVWIVCSGVKFQLTDRVSVQAGYSFNQNPVPDHLATFNVLAPAIYQHILNLGTSVQLTKSLVGTLTWVHAFDNTIEGPYLTPMGAVPLSRVAVAQEIDTLVLGLSVLF